MYKFGLKRHSSKKQKKKVKIAKNAHHRPSMLEDNIILFLAHLVIIYGRTQVENGKEWKGQITVNCVSVWCTGFPVPAVSGTGSMIVCSRHVPREGSNEPAFFRARTPDYVSMHNTSLARVLIPGYSEL